MFSFQFNWFSSNRSLNLRGQYFVNVSRNVRSSFFLIIFLIRRLLSRTLSSLSWWLTYVKIMKHLSSLRYMMEWKPQIWRCLVYVYISFTLAFLLLLCKPTGLSYTRLWVFSYIAGIFPCLLQVPVMEKFGAI